MDYDTLVAIMEMFTLSGILFSGIIFARLAFKAKNIGSFRFQLSIFMLVWVTAEIPHVAETLGWITTSYDDIGLALHIISMALFAIFIGVRSFQFFNSKPFPSSQILAETPTRSPISSPPGVLKHE
jgi:hypothetical protein